ncbi:hypothetical protein LEN26_001404 [Aphanomyces euteiches]|nr:hypothetical protein AeMF1_003002 [Aphanomyces euteiches]KAH9161451.1 hypothetical protein LEN26_001404 [Aphanomyces euteiches]KAH9188274.1 hypothetical protein AeNC1_009748 [Aphanomyces euteiches]
MFGRRPFVNIPRGRNAGGRGRNDGLLLVLLMQLYGQIQQLERKPPVTLALMGGMVGLFMYKGHPGVPSARRYALCPDVIVDRFDWKRLIVSAFLHVDEWHLYNNMASFLWKGVNLEFKYGSERFVQLIATLLVMSHVLAVAAAYTLATVLHDNSYIHQCSVGFSAVLFALKMVLNQNSPAYTNIMGITIPTKYAAWAELVYIHYFVPGSSLVGHLAGILAGYIYMKSPLWTLNLNFFTSQPRAYTYASGRADANNSRQPTYESDEAYARRLQEEEFRRRY